MKIGARLLGIMLILAVFWFVTPRAAHALSTRAVSAPIKVMPLGDSITSGTDQNYGTPMASYRCELHDSLVAAGYNVDFVGSVQGQWGILSKPQLPTPTYCTMLDIDEEGHSGWAIYDILNGAPNSWPGNLQTWVAAALPDVVLVHLGTVNFINTSPAPDVNAAITQMGQVIDTLRGANPRVKILLAQIIPSIFSSTTISMIPLYNALLPGLVASKARPYSPILLVDMYTGFDAATLTVDGTHPNPNGENKMAARWKAAFDKIIKINTWIFVPAVKK